MEMKEGGCECCCCLLCLHAFALTYGFAVIPTNRHVEKSL